MTPRLEGKVAIVTGAASWGFGRATAVRFAEEGARVMVADIDEPGARETVDRVRGTGSEGAFVVGDITDADHAQHLVDRTIAEFGAVDILVNNAGISQPYRPDSWATEEGNWDRVLRVNLRSVYTCTKAAVPAMIDGGGGAIVSVASIAASVCIGGAAYAATKGGMLSYTRHISSELASQGVRANCVSPGFMRTPMSTGERDGLTPEEQERQIAALGAGVPMGHTGSVEDIANAILFLSSDEAKYITGQELVVDGGYIPR